MRTLGNRLPITREKQLANLRNLHERKLRKIGQIRAHYRGIFLLTSELKKEQRELKLIEEEEEKLSQ
ncbi:MAG: hypothetical protein PHC53_02535 [Patescibacteria group bacterium]|nr:hypothetical protein [Patescibacteria group bacterium]